MNRGTRATPKSAAITARRPLRAVATLAMFGVLTTACSSSGSPTPTSSGSALSTDTTATVPTQAGQPSSAPVSTTSSSASATAAGQLAGTWKGTYVSTKYASTSGEFTVVFTQRASTISGTITIQPSCITNGTVSGTLTGSTIDFGAVKGQGRAVSFTGTLSGEHMQGSYHSDASCGTDNGTWSASRS